MKITIIASLFALTYSQAPAITIPTDIPIAQQQFIPIQTQQITIPTDIPVQTQPPIPPKVVAPAITIPTDIPNAVPPVTAATTTPKTTITQAVPATSESQPQTKTTTLPSPPQNYLYGYYGQLCMNPPLLDAKCRVVGQQIMTTELAKCEKDFDCCMCGSVSCNECQGLTVGNSGLLGVQLVEVNGRNPAAGGANIACKGSEACINTVITGSNIRGIDCSGYGGCAGATIRVYNPVTFFYLDCIGMGSCQGLTVELILPFGFTTSYETLKMHISRIACSGQASCDGLSFTIINDAKYPIEVENIDCLQHDACTNAQFDFSAYHAIANCQCGHSCQTATGIEKCFHNIDSVFCNDPISCKETKRNIVNPTNGFIFKCAAPNSCYNSQFNIELNPMGSNPSMFDGIMCNAVNACEGVVFNFDNKQFGGLVVEKLECGSKNSCKDATFVTGNNVEFGNIYCNVNTACDGCTITTEIGLPGIPCGGAQTQIIEPNVPILEQPIVTQNGNYNPQLPQLPQLPPQVVPQQQVPELPPQIVAV